MRKTLVNSILFASLTFSLGLQTPSKPSKYVPKPPSRREIICAMVASVAGPTCTTIKSSSVLAKEADNRLIDVYFGCGCFWHVHYEMVEAERRILKRDDELLTARVGYAGGTNIFHNNPKSVCYPNALNAWYGDYRKLGYGEVVSLRIPPSYLSDFVTEYIDLFDQDGNCPDQTQDVRSPYRNLIGLP